MSGQSVDSASSPKLYITGIYYNEALNKYFGMRGTGGDSVYHAHIFSSNTNTYVDAGEISSSRKVEFGNNANTAPEYVLMVSGDRAVNFEFLLENPVREELYDYIVNK
jgi:hypothetical protein